MKKQWHKIVLEFAKIALEELCGKLAAFANFAVFALLLMASLCGGWLGGGNQKRQLELTLMAGKWSTGRSICIATMVLLMAFFGSTVMLAKCGYIPYITIAGCIHELAKDATGQELTVLLFEDGNKLASKFTTVDKDGRFQFTGLKRRAYRMVVYRLGTNWFDLKEFSGDLRNNDLWRFDYNLSENLALEHYLVMKLVKCFFDTGRSELDPDATSAIDSVLATLPATQYRLMIFGHADETGGQQRNMELSKYRAVNAFSSLTNNGANGRNAILAFFGSQRPAAFGDSAQELAENRRAEIMVAVRAGATH